MSSARTPADELPRLPALLRLAAQVLNERLVGWLETSGYAGMQPAHSAVVQPLWGRPGGERVTALARASRITKQSMSALVAELEAGGYVERVRDPDDARAVRVRLTARGRAYGRAVRAFARHLEKEWAEAVGAHRIEELRSTLDLLRERVFKGD